MSELPSLFSPWRTGCYITSQTQTYFSFVSAQIKLAGGFHKGVAVNILQIIKGKTFPKREFRLLLHFFSSHHLFFLRSNAE